MKKTVNPELIILARESKGISQAELANLVGINQANISRIENGFIQISEEILEKISTALSYPINFFFEYGKTYSPQMHFFRKTKQINSKELSKINATSIIDRLRLEKLLNAIEIHTDYITYDLDEYGTPESIASALRQHWKVSMGAINNVTLLLESKGIIVFPVDFQSRLISDITTQTEKGIQIIFLNSNMPPDRKRFTLCHALGHIIMHRYSSNSNIEIEADRFAAEFLMPSNEIKHQLSSLNLEKLADLKKYWKVSMASILMKADHLNTISSVQKQYLWKRISALGYRLNEPFEQSIQNEEPTILKGIMNLYKNDLSYSEKDLEILLFLRDDEFPKYGINTISKLKLILNNQSVNN
jgi:Zn-dependent peptidase ImmA (M78 family)/DNA-binding XRE family transcriptional regulator